MGVPPADHAAPRDTRAHAGAWRGRPDRSWLMLAVLVAVGIAAGGIWAILAGSDEPAPVQTDAAAERSPDAASPPITPADVTGVADAAGMADAAAMTDAARSMDAAAVADNVDAGAGKVGGRDGPAQDTPSTSAAATSRAPLADADVKRLMAEATAAYKRHDYRRASRACTRVISHRPRHAGANRLCTMAACNQRSAVRARRYYRRVPESLRPLLRQLCQRFGVALEPPASQP